MHATKANQSPHYDRASYANYIIKSNYWCQLIIFYFRSVSLIKMRQLSGHDHRRGYGDQWCAKKIIKIIINSKPFQFWRLIFFILFCQFEFQYALAFSTDRPQNSHDAKKRSLRNVFFSVVCLFSIVIEKEKKTNIGEVVERAALRIEDGTFGFDT